MKHITSLIILALFFPVVSYSDNSVQGVLTSCTSTGFEIVAHNLENETPSASVVPKGQGKTAYFGTEKYAVSCEMGAHKLKAEFQIMPPRDRGACGGEPGANLSVWVNGNLLMQNQLFNNHCFESLNKIIFSQNKEREIAFGACGRRSLSGVIFDDCIEFKPEAFASLKKPFGSFPLSEMAEQKTED